jgi:hypothetical protein
MDSVQIASTQIASTASSHRRVAIAPWIVIALVGAAIIACAVVASLYGNVAATDLPDLPIGP